uniref:Uncharacterized protein n=2 Tax=Picea TaxID=3328 RepID=A0A117NGW9_PICGL|nr:hypothetical protein ABT39_MTgene5653 [Picea glauca]QHR90260.1 hypothetical protein Q903MT_gene4283 [Picea sitchensis]
MPTCLYFIVSYSNQTTFTHLPDTHYTLPHALTYSARNLLSRYHYFFSRGDEPSPGQPDTIDE